MLWNGPTAGLDYIIFQAVLSTFRVTLLGIRKFVVYSFSVTLNRQLQGIRLVGCVAQWLERWSLTGELSLSHARPAADG